MGGLEEAVKSEDKVGRSILTSRGRYTGPSESRIARAIMAAQDYGRDEESIRDPYEHGSNAYFSDIGLNNSFVNASVRRYNKDAVKGGARVAYDAGIREENRGVFNILFRLIKAEGEEVTRNLIFKVGMDPTQLADYSIYQKFYRKSTTRILAPNDVRTIVDRASSRDVASMLAQNGINLVYSTPTFMAFYANR
ncbi:hypothetical protein HYU50_04090 [Candidatus Woesearchaeota archaeon]|nr:hypothetical protein [Candidatus Woesearchaeota archaeon]